MMYVWTIGILIVTALLYPSSPASTAFKKEDLNLKEINKLIEERDRANQLLSLTLPNFDKEKLLFSTIVTVTSYNPLEEQCDDSPLIDSNNKLVMPGTVAMPKKYRKKIGIELGQTILLEDLGLFTVTGHMNGRFEDQAKVDVISFIPKWSKEFGVHEGVKMFWW